MRIVATENNQRIMVELGERFKDTRISSEFTQKELADRAGISLKTIERIENGENVKIENIINYMRALGILQNLDIVVPEQNISPVDILKLGKKRKRVRRSKKVPESNGEWKWADE